MGKVKNLIDGFLKKRDEDGKLLSTDQLLNAVYLTGMGIDMSREELQKL